MINSIIYMWICIFIPRNMICKIQTCSNSFFIRKFLFIKIFKYNILKVIKPRRIRLPAPTHHGVRKLMEFITS